MTDVPAAGGTMYAFVRIAGRANSLELAKDIVRDVSLGHAPGGDDDLGQSHRSRVLRRFICEGGKGNERRREGARQKEAARDAGARMAVHGGLLLAKARAGLPPRNPGEEKRLLSRFIFAMKEKIRRAQSRQDQVSLRIEDVRTPHIMPHVETSDVLAPRLHRMLPRLALARAPSARAVGLV